MARFYGTIQGQRGPTSRLGSVNSGLQITAQSYSGDVVVNLMVNAKTDEDWVSIHAREHGTGVSAMLYYGPIKPLLDKFGHDFLVTQMAHRAMEKENKSASE
ncbi:MAG TPA: hypothetical protein VGU68_06025 [Ktedonobacteraceae bacterium]|nr:hypothetical protein [Ktedonobacteraceae bacterium]